MKRNTALTSTYKNEFDKAGTLSTQNASGVQSDPVSRVGRSVLVAIGITLFTPAYAGSPDVVKQLKIK
jgi:hypothetical protein